MNDVVLAGGWSRRELHEHIRASLRQLRGRVGSHLLTDFDELMERRHLLSDDTDVLFHPLGQPLVSAPLWIAEAVGVTKRQLVFDMVEASVVGYLHVRVHDDRMDENIGDPDRSTLLSTAFLVRHQSLLARHVTDPEFWDFFEGVAHRYAEAMLLEREVSAANAHYDEAVFDRVLDRSQPLVLPGAALLSIAGRWHRLDALDRFIHHTVKAGQLIDDTIDCRRDLEAGNHTWVVRLLGGIEDPDGIEQRLLVGGIDDIVERTHVEIDRAQEAARELQMESAVEWLADRRSNVDQLKEALLMSVFEE